MQGASDPFLSSSWTCQGRLHLHSQLLLPSSANHWNKTEINPVPSTLSINLHAHGKSKRLATCVTNGSFTLPKTDSDTDSDSDSKPDGYIALCWLQTQISTSYFCVVQESESLSVSESVSSNINEPWEWLIKIVVSDYESLWGVKYGFVYWSSVLIQVSKTSYLKLFSRFPGWCFSTEKKLSWTTENVASLDRFRWQKEWLLNSSVSVSVSVSVVFYRWKLIRR